MYVHYVFYVLRYIEVKFDLVMLRHRSIICSFFHIPSLLCKREEKTCCKILNSFQTQLEFPQEYEKFLTNPAFQINNLTPVIEAAKALETVIDAQIPPHLIHLQVSYN